MSVESLKHTLDQTAIQEDFFEGCALIGIASAEQGYRLCWLLNNYFNIDFLRDVDSTKSFTVKPGKRNAAGARVRSSNAAMTEIEYFFAVYTYCLPGNSDKYHLYKLKDRDETLLPEARQLDYLWMLETPDAYNDAMNIAQKLRDIPEIQMARIMVPDELENLASLLL